MKIAFFTNHYKTVFFNALASRLEKRGHTIYWISTSRIWTNWLIEQSVPRSHILDLTMYGHEWTTRKRLTPDEEQELASVELAGGLTINNMILMDRLLRLKPHTYARSYMYVVHREVKRFLMENHITSLFLEATWAPELLAIMLGKVLGLSTYCPHTIRIPGDRFTFFEGHRQLATKFIREPDEKDFDDAKRFFAHFLSNRPRPNYWHANNKLPKIHLNWFGKLLDNIRRRSADPFDEMQPGTMYLVRKRLQEVWNGGMISLAKPFEAVHLPISKPYVLYTLHQQPEASIDVLGPYFSNQEELIKSLSRSLPSTYELYVKEHRVSIGERPLSWYKAVRRIPGVRLIDPFADSHELINNADLVITVSGTSAYEAAIYGKPAVTVTPMFFGPILTVNGFNIHKHGLQTLLKRLENWCPYREPNNAKQDIIKFFAWVIAQSFKGVISDPMHQPECMEQENIERVSSAMAHLLATQKTDAMAH